MPDDKTLTDFHAKYQVLQDVLNSTSRAEADLAIILDSIVGYTGGRFLQRIRKSGSPKERLKGTVAPYAFCIAVVLSVFSLVG